MAVTEASRHPLYERLDDVLGHEQATTLMEHLPPVGWTDIATRNDIQLVRADIDVVRADIDVVRADIDVVRADIDVVRADVEALRTSIDHRFEAVDHRFEALGESLRTEIHKELAGLHRELRVQLFAMMTYGVTLAGLILSAVHFV